MKNGLYDIYELWHVPFWQTNWFFWVLGGVFCLLTLGIIWYSTKRFKRPQVEISAWERARNTIEAFNQLSAQDSEPFYVLLSSTLKTYLYERFSFELLGKTDQEVIEFLEKSFLDSTVCADIEKILKGGLYAKFANAQVIQEQMKQDKQRALEIITATMPQEKHESIQPKN